MMRKFTCLLISIAVAGTTWSAETEKVWRSVRGAELQKLFADQELGDGVHYAYQFKSSGTFTGTEMARDVRGTWKATAKQICWTWIKPVGSEECYEVRRSGRDITLFRNGYEASSGTLTPINGNKLAR